MNRLAPFRRELIWRWANAHSVVVVVWGTLALGRVILMLNADMGLSTWFALTFTHLALANLILAWLLLPSHPPARRIVVAAGGFALGVLVGVGLSGIVPLSSAGPTAISLIMVTPSVWLLAIAFMGVRHRPENVLSKTRLFSAIYIAAAIVGIFVQSSMSGAVMTGAMVSTALHAVWMSALYTFADHGLRLRFDSLGPKSEA